MDDHLSVLMAIVLHLYVATVWFLLVNNVKQMQNVRVGIPVMVVFVHLQDDEVDEYVVMDG